MNNEARKRLLAGVSATERRIRLAGAETAVLEAGAGPPMVLMHGGIECGGVYWAPVMARLAEQYRLVVPDLPGLGESAPFARLDLDAFAEWFAALVPATCAEKPVLVAHSMLGSVAARFAARHRGHIRRLVIYGTPGVGPYRMPLGLLAAAILFARAPSPHSVDRFSRWAFLHPGQADVVWFDTLLGYVVARARVAHVARTMRELIALGKRPIPAADLRRINVPTALLWGRHDRMVPLRIGNAAYATCGWSLHVVEEAGHVPHIERPEEFLTALRSALQA